MLSVVIVLPVLSMGPNPAGGKASATMLSRYGAYAYLPERSPLATRPGAFTCHTLQRLPAFARWDSYFFFRRLVT